MCGWSELAPPLFFSFLTFWCGMCCELVYSASWGFINLKPGSSWAFHLKESSIHGHTLGQTLALMIEHDVILSMLKCYGFDDRFIGWINSILTSSTSSALLNGVLAKKIHRRWEVWGKGCLSRLFFMSLQLISFNMSSTRPAESNSSTTPSCWLMWISW
jgi:hypothetical protein